MTDLVKRLRDTSEVRSRATADAENRFLFVVAKASLVDSAIMHEAASRIETLEAEMARLRYEINEVSDPYFLFGAMDNVNDMDVSVSQFADAASRAIRAAIDKLMDPHNA